MLHTDELIVDDNDEMAIEIDDELVLLDPTPLNNVPANVSINHL